MDPTVAAVFISNAKDRHVGLAVHKPRNRADKEDPKTATLILYEFLDQERYVNLEAMLVRHAPDHVYLADVTEAENKKVQQLVEGSPGMVLDIISRSKFNDADAVRGLEKLSGGALPFDADEVKFARKAAACILAKGGLLERPDAAGSVEVVLSRHDAYMRLDAAALRALNLFPSAGQGAAAVVAANSGAGAGGEGDGGAEDTGAGAGGAGSSSSSSGRAAAGSSAAAAAASKTSFARSVTSLHGLLSHGCRTKGGRRLLKAWILQPLLDAPSIGQRQRLVSAFVHSPTLRKAWREGLNVPDLDALAGRLTRKAANLLDLLRLYQFAVLLPTLAQRLAAYDGPAEYGEALAEGYAERLKWAAGEFAKYCEMCEQVIEDVTSPDPRVNPSWDEELKELAEERGTLEGEILGLFQDATRDGGWASALDGDLKCERDKVRGFVFRTRRTNEKALRGIPGASICQVLKDGIYFTTTGNAGLRRLSERLQEVEASYEAKGRAVVAQAVEIARSYAPVLEAATAFISELDAFSSMAHLAVSAPGAYVCPTLTPAGSGDVRVTAGRHPVMEMQEGVTFIPNDYVMERDASRFQIVTGPNTGGKSTWIRTLGVLSVMAQMGCYVPADAATLPIMDCICARVGAGDKAVKGVSTFMAEMLEAGSIMGIAGPASLVIVDELGRGTSTYDGFGLAWAISEHLAATTRCMTLFATHFHELTALAGTQAGVVNRHVSAHTTADSITMLFAVKDGPCPSSFGIHVAEMAAFPPSVVATAREKAAQLEASTGSASAYMMGAGAGIGDAGGAAGGGTAPAGAEIAADGKVAAAKRVAREIAAGSADATAAAFEALPLSAKRRRVGDLLAEAEA